MTSEELIAVLAQAEDYRLKKAVAVTAESELNTANVNAQNAMASLESGILSNDNETVLENLSNQVVATRVLKGQKQTAWNTAIPLASTAYDELVVLFDNIVNGILNPP